MIFLGDFQLLDKVSREDDCAKYKKTTKPTLNNATIVISSGQPFISSRHQDHFSLYQALTQGQSSYNPSHNPALPGERTQPGLLVPQPGLLPEHPSPLTDQPPISERLSEDYKIDPSSRDEAAETPKSGEGQPAHVVLAQCWLQAKEGSGISENDCEHS